MFLSFKQFLAEGMVPGISPGTENESVILDAIRSHLDKVSPLTIILQSATKKKVYRDITDVLDRSKDTRNRKKADFVLISKDMKEYPISLKNDKADFWESCDGLMGAKARKIIDRLVSKGKIQLNYDKDTENYSIDPHVALKATPEEASAVMFGTDILPKGAVIKRTFSPDDFVLDNDTLTISCTEVITSVNDVTDTYMEPWFFIRSEQGRNVVPLGYRGLRCLAAYKRRIDTDKILKI